MKQWQPRQNEARKWEKMTEPSTSDLANLGPGWPSKGKSMNTSHDGIGLVNVNQLT